MPSARARAGIVGGVVGALGLLAAGCGSSGSTATAGQGSSTGQGSTGSTSATSTVKLASVSKVGNVLVDAQGHTVYYFAKDSKDHATCTGACAKVWPPLTVSGSPVAGSGVKASMLGTTKDADGKTQVTYHGWPLYTYAADTKAGVAHGEGLKTFGGLWWALTSAGTAAHPAGSSGSSSSGGGGGGGW